MFHTSDELIYRTMWPILDPVHPVHWCVSGHCVEHLVCINNVCVGLTARYQSSTKTPNNRVRPQRPTVAANPQLEQVIPTGCVKVVHITHFRSDVLASTLPNSKK